MARLVQLVLAGGQSERMGRPKALLPFGERTSLARVVDAARQAGIVESVIVVGGGGEDLVKAHAGRWPGTTCLWTFNRVAGSEQVDSLKIGLQELVDQPPEGFFLQPVDVPLVEAGDYRLLVEAWKRRSPDGPRVFKITHGEQSGHPVLCSWHLAAGLLALPPGATAREVLGGTATERVETPNHGVLDDMDTPEDYERLLAAWRRGVGGA